MVPIAPPWGAADTDHDAGSRRPGLCPLAGNNVVPALPPAPAESCNDRPVSRSVLVVDDDATFRQLAIRLLAGLGYRVVGEAGSVAEALVRADELRPDAVLVDIGLPDGDGFSLTQQLRS